MNLTALHHPLLAIVRGTDADAALQTVFALADEDITAIEVSLTTPDALRVIERARRSLGAHVLLGAGTVRTPDDAARAADAGACFLVTPALLNGPPPGLPVVMGALTPTEITTAMDRGAHAVKLFPSSLGGPGYSRHSAGRSPTFPSSPSAASASTRPAPISPPAPAQSASEHRSSAMPPTAETSMPCACVPGRGTAPWRTA